MRLASLPTVAALASGVAATFNAAENATHFVLENSRLSVAFAKEDGRMVDTMLDGVDFLGPRNGNSGTAYVSSSWIPSDVPDWKPGGPTAKFQLIKGLDSTGTPYGGVIMEDTYAVTNQSAYTYWFLRGEETGLHTFSRITYFNESRPLLRDLGEHRTLFRPNTDLWTHLVSSKDNWAPLPGKKATSARVTVQDATHYLGNTPDDAYVQQYSEYFTKYTFSEVWRNHDVHGHFADGSNSPDGKAYGAWLVINTRETYFGGPLRSDLVVDENVYNYVVAGHHGAPVPNITHGFDRTWGPQFYYFNSGKAGTTLEDLRSDAAQHADPRWNAEFYDSIAQYVPNYTPSSGRLTFRAKVDIPEGAKRAIIVLSENKQDFQLNVFDMKALQYWGEIQPDGKVAIPRVVEGTYRVTVYAEGAFGWFIQDDVEVSKRTKGDKECIKQYKFTWEEETSGKEIWRIGTPDKSAGEYRHGYAPDTTKPLSPEEYRIYWAKWDFPTDFPRGVHFEVGKSKEAVDFNYIHWSVFGGRGNFVRPEPVLDKVSNWTVSFDLTAAQFEGAKTATLTVQLAGVKTANGNRKWAGQLPGEPYSWLPYTVGVNDGAAEETWVIPYWRSGSCGVRSSVVCQNTEHKFVFEAGKFKEGKNELVLSLPYNATNVEPALLPSSVYVQYDALRFELA